MTSQERRIGRLIKPWIRRLGLVDWDITIELAPDDSLNQDGWVPGFSTDAECAAQWEYQMATIRIGSDGLDARSDVDLETTLVHELMHVMLNELHDEETMKHEERTAVLLTRAFLRAAA